MFLHACLVAATIALGQTNPADEEAVRDVVNQTTTAWNSRDAKALASLYSEDADYVNSRGQRVVGREKIEIWLRARFQLPTYRDSNHKRLSISVRFLSPTCAIADSTWEMSNVKNEAGNVLPVRKGNSTMIVIQTNGRWLIAALRSMVPTKD